MPSERISVFSNDDATLMVRRNPQDGDALEIFARMDADSPIQGDFDIAVQTEIELRHLEARHRAQLATMFLDLQDSDRLPVEITVDLLEQARSRQPTPVIERAERLLHFFHSETSEVGEDLRYEPNDSRLSLFSESVSNRELAYLISYLDEQGLVTPRSTIGRLGVQLTVAGFSHIARQATAPDSSQAFVAMWFNPSMEKPYSDGIAPGIRGAGYEPFRVDLAPTLHRIDDQIIAGIRRSRFLIADFTHDDRGARGSVYYEAGFAHGLGIPVIFTCRQDLLDDLHFDTRQYPHIGWNEPDELRDMLTYRIEALIGKGPKAATD